MEITYAGSGDLLTIYLNGELDEFSAGSARPVLDKIVAENVNYNKIVFDLSGITFMDSTGVGLLIGRYKNISKFNKKAFITGASIATEKVLQLSGIYRIMPKF